MLLLTTYMDETGHSRDEKQKFNGMGGLACNAEEWERFETRWGKMLDRFEIPYIHMKESRELFDGWSETKKKALSKAAWDKIENIKPLPIGSIIPMDDFRRAEGKFRDFFEDPYFIAMQDCVREVVLGTLKGNDLLAKIGRDPEFRAAMVFSDQVEFRYDALKMFEALREWLPSEMRDKIYPPDFRDMREWGALQAADMVAYEIYKERERVYYNLRRDHRYGYKRMLDITKKRNLNPIILNHDAQSLSTYLDLGVRARQDRAKAEK